MRFIVKPNFGHFKVVDSTTGKMVVGYRIKSQAEVTAAGLNSIKTGKALQSRIASLKTTEGYGFFVKKRSDK